MRRKPVRRFEAALFVLLVVSVLFPLAARAQSDAIDVTATFRNAGVDVDHLLVYQTDSVRGVVRIGGSVERELQKHFAIELMRKIKGVKEVHSDLAVL